MRHQIFTRNLEDEPQEHEQEIVLGAGCFWGVERKFWQLDDVTNTSVGYAGGKTQYPTYQEVCSGVTDHVEVVKITYKNNQETLKKILKSYWEMHDPTQGMRQGNDIGTQYRSVIFYKDSSQLDLCKSSLEEYQSILTKTGLSEITTTIEPLKIYFYAEEYHQQYLHKNPNGYCGLGGTGCSFPE